MLERGLLAPGLATLVFWVLLLLFATGFTGRAFFCDATIFFVPFDFFGAGLTARELRYFVEREWAQTSEDVLWRRTKAGLLMTPAQCQRVAKVLGA